ncbi:YqaJ viral recombinase family nuclease [Thalassospira sp. CH_XMU1420-2]|jgi:putative phage-type endonuclease|uniref:YqaJ viral recombinase family nuclease n=1 Tax=Thalassospira sp. CH_XMU1420-2 TaxID=3107769 RepID=UPI00300B8040|tara:strand:- start:9287 stop:10249 length:963 start_codon:yes stop_codon:yes gene_type:complete
MFELVNIEQRSPEWFEWRKQGVTATDVAAILGYEVADHFDSAEFKTPFKVWARKKGLLDEPDLSRVPAVQYGVANEERARCWFEDHTGKLADPGCVMSTVYPGLRASLDGLTIDGIPVELKCPTEKRFDEMLQLKERSPLFEYYWHQLQTQMAVLGATKGYLVFWRHDRDPVIFTVYRNDHYVDQMLSAVKNFYHNHILTDVPPEKDPDRDVFVPEGNDAVLWEKEAAEYRRLQEIEADAKEQRQAIRERLGKRIGNHYAGEFAGLRISKVRAAGRPDVNKFCEDHNIPVETLDAYRSEPSSQLRVTLSAQRQTVTRQSA